MKLSTKSRYASRALIELGLKYGEGPVKLKDISAIQDISLKYLEQVMFPLRIGGYVKTLKGSQGGYILARHPNSITLLEIVECVEGPIAPVDCVDRPGFCGRSEQCVTRDAWIGLKNVIRSELGNTTLDELVAKQRQIDG
ncbi:MAG: Rrf2 family transcriptional regulator [Firmicutes bacterium]|nr:Rrf2 family transcriptional regulator [Bacillota bacterium]